MVLTEFETLTASSEFSISDGGDFFYALPENVTTGSLLIVGDEFRHLRKSMRKSPGDTFWVVDGEGRAYGVILDSYSTDSARCSIMRNVMNLGEPTLQLTLGLGILKGRHFEDALATCAQIGLSELVPIQTARSVRTGVNMDRLNNISLSAMKQCGRSRCVKISETADIQRFLDMTANAGLKLIAAMEKNASSIGEAAADFHTDDRSAVILVGPEGDFTREERDAAAGAGFVPVTLGPRRLRSETAAATAVTLLMDSFDELKGRKHDEL